MTPPPKDERADAVREAALRLKNELRPIADQTPEEKAFTDDVALVVEAAIAAQPVTEASAQPSYRNNDEKAASEFFRWNPSAAVLAWDWWVNRGRASAQPSKAPEALTYEQEIALRDSEQIAAADSYFGARPQVDTTDRRRVYEAGFRAAWHPPAKPEAPEALTDAQIEAGYRAFDWSSVPHPFRGSVGFERGARWAEAAIAKSAAPGDAS